MRPKVPLFDVPRFVVCLSIGLAGCAAGTPRLSQLPIPPAASDDRSATVAETAAPSVPREPPAESGRERQADAAVKAVQFELASADVEPAPILPAPVPGQTPEASIQYGGAADDSATLTFADPMSSATTFELDFSTALAMVSGQNPQVAFASQRYREAYAQLESARVLWLPSIRAGVSYNKHEGVLQAADGTVFDSSRGSLYSGSGARSVGTGSPAVPGLVAEFHFTDAVFLPRIANRAALARHEATQATTHDLLLEAALAYLGLLEASQGRVIAEETLENAQQLADLTAAFAETGQGPQADADRARAALVVRKNDVARAEEEVRVVSARLNELLHNDPTTVLRPQEPTIVPVELVSRTTPVAELLATGLSNRPELAESRHLVCEAVHRYRREKFAPLLPSAFLGVSYGGFGGAPGARIDNFRDRFDLDAVAYWELRNFGFGEAAAREEARSRYQQARLREIQIMDRVAREIVEAGSQVQARHRQIAVAQSGIEAATDSYQRNVERIRAGEGLPIEVLQAIHALDEARREYLRTLVDYNEAQFRLFRALGWPIQ